jgi:hypothetical protein
LRRVVTNVALADFEAALEAETAATIAAFGEADTARRIREATP